MVGATGNVARPHGPVLVFRVGPTGSHDEAAEVTLHTHRARARSSSRTWFACGRSRVKTLTAVILAVTITAAPATPAWGDASRQLGIVRQALETARAERAVIEERMQAIQLRIEEHYARQAALEVERDLLERQLAAQASEAARLEERVGLRLRQAYMHGSAIDPVATFFAADDPAGGLLKAETVRWLVAGDSTRVEELAAARASASSTRTILDARLVELERLADDLALLTSALEEDLLRARRLEESLDSQVRVELERIDRQRREAEAARQRDEASARQPMVGQPVGGSATPSVPTACPIDQPHTFIDSWGHPRSGGRRHRGTDLMAPHGLPVRAITDGVWVHQRPGRSAGIWGVLRGDDGASYRYLHLSSHTATNGARVAAGDEVGRNGATGNASTPHLHFEVHPGGAGAINPYPLLRSLCG